MEQDRANRDAWRQHIFMGSEGRHRGYASLTANAVAFSHSTEVFDEAILPRSLGYQPCSMEIAIHTPAQSKQASPRVTLVGTPGPAAASPRNATGSSRGSTTSSMSGRLTTSTTSQPQSPLVFLFRLQLGAASPDSHALYCAALSGVPEEPVLRRARYVTRVAVIERDVAKLQLEALVAPTHKVDEAAMSPEQKAKRAEAILRRFVEWDLNGEKVKQGKKRRVGGISVAQRLAQVLDPTAE